MLSLRETYYRVHGRALVAGISGFSTMEGFEGNAVRGGHVIPTTDTKNGNCEGENCPIQ